MAGFSDAEYRLDCLLASPPSSLSLFLLLATDWCFDVCSDGSFRTGKLSFEGRFTEGKSLFACILTVDIEEDVANLLLSFSKCCLLVSNSCLFCALACCKKRQGTRD